MGLLSFIFGSERSGGGGEQRDLSKLNNQQLIAYSRAIDPMAIGPVAARFIAAEKELAARTNGIKTQGSGYESGGDDDECYFVDGVCHFY